MHFESPWAFLLLIAIPAILYVRRATWRRGGIRFSTVTYVEKTGRSLRQRLSLLPLVFKLIAIGCLIVALARPQTGGEQVRKVDKGIAIEMVVDRSNSMATEMNYHGRRLSRLEMVRKVLLDFVLGNEHDLAGRPNDLIGIVAFARFPDTICPLTLAHDTLPLFTKNIKIATRPLENGTAIGDALALAAARLKIAETTLRRDHKPNGSTYRIKSKIIILLSDGRNNCGRRTPLESADLARKWGIKVHTIAMGAGTTMTSTPTPFGVSQVPINEKVDRATLQAIARKTGGVFRDAGNSKNLISIYREIDKMEKSDIQSVQYIHYREDFVRFALAGLLLGVVGLFLSCTFFRKIL
jgi:Ca-activated chloride channel homolog